MSLHLLTKKTTVEEMKRGVRRQSVVSVTLPTDTSVTKVNEENKQIMSNEIEKKKVEGWKKDWENAKALVDDKEFQDFFRDYLSSKSDSNGRNLLKGKNLFDEKHDEVKRQKGLSLVQTSAASEKNISGVCMPPNTILTVKTILLQSSLKHQTDTLQTVESKQNDLNKPQCLVIVPVFENQSNIFLLAFVCFV